MTTVGRSVVSRPRTTVGRMVSMEEEHHRHGEQETVKGLFQQGVNLLLYLRPLVGNDDYFGVRRKPVQSVQRIAYRPRNLDGVGFGLFYDRHIDGRLAVGAGDAGRGSLRQLHVGHFAQQHRAGWGSANYQIADVLHRTQGVHRLDRHRASPAEYQPGGQSHVVLAQSGGNHGKSDAVGKHTLRVGGYSNLAVDLAGHSSPVGFRQYRKVQK